MKRGRKKCAAISKDSSWVGNDRATPTSRLTHSWGHEVSAVAWGVASRKRETPHRPQFCVFNTFKVELIEVLFHLLIVLKIRAAWTQKLTRTSWRKGSRRYNGTSPRKRELKGTPSSLQHLFVSFYFAFFIHIFHSHFFSSFMRLTFDIANKQLLYNNAVSIEFQL